jgi:uncharacterized membrane protein
MTPDTALSIVAGLGLLLSAYVVYVEQRLEGDAAYQPLCDSKDLGMSCSAVFTSDAGHLLSFLGLVPKGSSVDLSNGVAGVLFYLALMLIPNLTFLPKDLRVWLTVLASIGSTAVSVILGYVMVYRLRNFCFVCTAIHIVNAIILVWTMRWLGQYFSQGKKRKMS